MWSIYIDYSAADGNDNTEFDEVLPFSKILITGTDEKSLF